MNSLFPISSSKVVMQRTARALVSTSAVRLSAIGVTFNTAGQLMDDDMNATAYKQNERGIRSSSMFPEPNTAIYDSYQPWTYFEPIKVDIEKMPAPEAKYYQKLTKKPWDISTTELMEVQARKKYVHSVIYFFMWICIYFILPKEKTFVGTRGADGKWMMLPKNQPEIFN